MLQPSKNDLLERTRFYKGEEKPEELLDSIEMAGLCWDYERVWVEKELNPDDFYKEMVAYFQRTFNSVVIRTDIPLGLQAIFANRIEHWGYARVTLNSLNNFIDDYLKAADEYEKRRLMRLRNEQARSGWRFFDQKIRKTTQNLQCPINRAMERNRGKTGHQKCPVIV